MILRCPKNDATGKCPCDYHGPQKDCGLGKSFNIAPITIPSGGLLGVHCPTHGFYPRLTCPICTAEHVEVSA